MIRKSGAAHAGQGDTRLGPGAHWCLWCLCGEISVEVATLNVLTALTRPFQRDRQKRFTFDEDNYYVDLVLYNRLLQCYVLIDLKIDNVLLWCQRKNCCIKAYCFCFSRKGFLQKFNISFHSASPFW